MRFRNELISRLERNLGEGANTADLVDELYGRGLMDESRALQYVAADEAEKRYGSTDKSVRQVIQEIADELGTSTSTVYRSFQRLKH